GVAPAQTPGFPLDDGSYGSLNDPVTDRRELRGHMAVPPCGPIWNKLVWTALRSSLPSAPIKIGVKGVSQGMDGHGSEPQHEAGLMEQQELMPPTAWAEDQDHPQCQDAYRQQHHGGAEDPEQQWWRALRAVGGRSCVVTHEAPASRSHLEQHWRY